MCTYFLFSNNYHQYIGPRTTEICILYIGKKAGILASWNLYIGILLCEIGILIQEFHYIVIVKLVYWYVDWFSRYIGFLKFGILVYQTFWSRTLEICPEVSSQNYYLHCRVCCMLQWACKCLHSVQLQIECLAGWWLTLLSHARGKCSFSWQCIFSNSHCSLNSHHTFLRLC